MLSFLKKIIEGVAANDRAFPLNNYRGLTAEHLEKLKRLHNNDVNKIRAVLFIYSKVSGWANYIGKQGYSELISQLGPNYYDIAGMTPIHYLAQAGDINGVKYILSNGGNINISTNMQKETALNIAAGWGNLPMVEFLLANGADPNIKNSADMSPLDKATMELHQETDPKCQAALNKIILLLTQDIF